MGEVTRQTQQEALADKVVGVQRHLLRRQLGGQADR